MKKDRKFGYESEWLHELFYKALEGHKDPQEREDLHSVMEQIQDFLDLCYMMGINPLRELRRMLPQYTWQFHTSKDKGYIRKTVSSSDFIWRVNWMEDMPEEWCEKIEFVTATKPDRNPSKHPSYFYVEAKHDGEKQDRMIAFVEVHEGGPVYYTRAEEES